MRPTQVKKRKRDEDAELNDDNDGSNSSSVEQHFEDELASALASVSETELLMNSFRQEFRSCCFYPPMIFMHQFSAFYRSLAQQQTSGSSSTLTCTDAGQLSVVDAGDLAKNFQAMRKTNKVKAIVPRIGQIQDILYVNTDDYIQHLAVYLSGGLLDRFTKFLEQSDVMSFSMNMLVANDISEADVQILLEQGILRKDNFMSLTPNVNTEDKETACYWLSSSIIGSMLGSYQEGETAVVRALRKGKYKELLETKLKQIYLSSLSKKLGNKLLPWRFVMLEMYHRDIIKTIQSPRGTVIRLV